MGVLPLQFPDGERAESLGLTGEEEISITGLDGGEAKEVTVARATRSSRRACGSTPRRRSSTTSTAASCRSCCARLADAHVTCPASWRSPTTLRKLLTAAGPSGYEQAPAAVFREAAAAFAEVTYDTVGSTVARVRRHRRRPVGRDRRPHRRDRPDRPPHRRRRLPVVHRRRRLGPDHPRRPARRDRHARRRRSPAWSARSRSTCSKRGRPQEGARAQAPAHRHRREGRRRGALARAHRRRRGDRRRAGRAAQRARWSRARWTTGSAASSRSRRRGWSPRRAARPATSPRVAVAQEEITFARRAHDRVLARARHRDRRRRDVRDRPAGHRREGARRATSSARAR